MDAAPPPHSDMPHPPAGAAPDPRAAAKRTELVLDALKAALDAPGEHRLFRAGKLAGLFPVRTGPAAEAALAALSDGLLETVRTETKGKVVTEWVRATPKAVGFVADRDSPKAVLRELRDVLQAGRAGVPAWLEEAKAEAARLSDRFEARAGEVLKRLDDLAARVDAALRRADAAPRVADPVARVVPWAVAALEYLDRRADAGVSGDCPLPELFHAVRVTVPDLALPAFQDGLRRLHDVRAVRLSAGGDLAEPEFAMLADGEMVYRVGR